MSLVFCALRNISFNDSNHILKFFTKGFENLPSSFFFLIPKTCYQVVLILPLFTLSSSCLFLGMPYQMTDPFASW